ncbi:MAG: acyl-CoA thioesterase [Flavobacteriaceae bacterium]|nr:acyl-CoA thioesterase [Flavobacteriaceae bacterium]
MINKTFTYTLTVSRNDIDTLNHVNNVTYLNWVQNAAQKHWSVLSNADIDNKYVWVVIRHEIDYFLPAMLNDVITVTTYIGDSYGVKSERFVEIKRGDRILAKAKTIWCLLDKKAMKPVKFPSEIINILHMKKSKN